MSCNKPVIFSPVYKSLHASNICSVSKTVPCSVRCKPVNALISSEPVKPFFCVNLFVLIILVRLKNLTLLKLVSAIFYQIFIFAPNDSP